MYCSVLSVLSIGVVLLIRLREPALDLCRLTNSGDREKASLETVRVLSLPDLTVSASLQYVGRRVSASTRDTRLSRNTVINIHRHSGSSTGGAPCLGTASSVVMQVNGLSGYFRTIDLTMRCRTLLK